MLRDMPFNDEQDNELPYPIKKNKVSKDTEKDDKLYSKEEVQFLLNQLEDYRKVQKNIALEGPPSRVRLNPKGFPIGIDADKSDINSKTLESAFNVLTKNLGNLAIVGLLAVIGSMQLSNSNLNKSRTYTPVFTSMKMEDKEPNYLKEILSQNQQHISMQNQVLKESKQLTDAILTKLGKAADKDMEVTISLNTQLTNQQLDLNSLNQVVENLSLSQSQSLRNSRVSETLDNTESALPAFMRTPQNSVASSFRPLSRSSRIQPSISISVSKKF